MAQSNLSTSNAISHRPWLLPANRKLRNLLSISLRNLSLAPTSPTRTRGKTIDDDAIPQTLQSPTKLVALRQQQTLGHSRSSSDLRAVAEDALVDSAIADVGADINGIQISGKQKPRLQSSSSTTSKRPQFQRLRRRSTVGWANASPQKRQERLEDVTRERLADTFYTLHVSGIEEPVYTSEMVERTMNPNFRHLDWTACGPGTTRLEQLTLRVWVRRAQTRHWAQLLDLQLNMRTLHYLGPSLNSTHRTLPQNAVLFHLKDGIYMASSDRFTDHLLQSPPHFQWSPNGPLPQHRTLPTSSFDALLRLSKLDDSIQDALATRNKIAFDLDTLLRTNRATLNEQDELAKTHDRLKTIDFAKKMVEKQLAKARNQQDEKRASIIARRKLMISNTASRQVESRKMQNARPEVPGMREEHQARLKALQNQRRRICEDLQRCYPVEPLPGQSLAFVIGGLRLPNTEDIDTEPPETISAALGSVAQVLQLLAFYLRQSLPYPVTPRGSTSTIYDPISILKSTTSVTTEKKEQNLRTYPLFSKGVPRFRFDYAIFLLNQNIRVLLESAFDLRVLDIRQTLPNLKYLFYIATAGEGELPTRKAGGVKGLLRGPALQRLASNDSTSSGMSGLTLLDNDHYNGKPHGAADRLRKLGGKDRS